MVQGAVQETKYKMGCIVWSEIEDQEMSKFARVETLCTVQQKLQDL